MSTIEKLIQIESAEIGTKAEANKVCKYNTAYYGKEYGADWCVVFQWWAFKQAGLSKYFCDGGKTASCGAFYNWAKSKGLTVTEPQVGDIIIFTFNGVAHCHMGLCVAVTAKQITTIDGNTSTSGSQSQGGQVLKRTRGKQYIWGIVRPAYSETTSDKIYYTVVKGDNLTKIAKKYGTTYTEIMKLNGLTKTTIYVGQRLRVK